MSNLRIHLCVPPLRVRMPELRAPQDTSEEEETQEKEEGEQVHNSGVGEKQEEEKRGDARKVILLLSFNTTLFSICTSFLLFLFFLVGFFH